MDYFGAIFKKQFTQRFIGGVKMSLKCVQDCLVASYQQDLLDEEFCFLYDANKTSYPLYDHEQFARFQLDQVSEEECLSSFWFRRLDIPHLAHVLRLPSKFVCANRTSASAEEIFCILFEDLRIPADRKSVV